MSKMTTARYKCSVCHTVSKHEVLCSTSTFGDPDLDSRPAPLKRFTMDTWIQECPKCGYVSRTISDKSLGISRDWLKSKLYRTCDGIKFESDLAKRFYRYYLINMKKFSLFYGLKRRRAFNALLYASWACDDEEDARGARKCRRLALRLMDKMIIKKLFAKDEFLLFKIDIMRKAGLFDRIIREYEGKKFKENLFNQLLEFELERAEQRDDSAYSYEDVLGS